MARKVLSSDILLNPASLLGVLNAATESLTTDPQLANIENLRDLALSMKDLRPKDITFTTMPWKQSGDGSTVVVAKKRAAPLWSAIANDTPWPPKADKDQPLLKAAPQDVRVEIINATGQKGTGKQAKRALTNEGFTVVNVKKIKAERIDEVPRQGHHLVRPRVGRLGQDVDLQHGHREHRDRRRSRRDDAADHHRAFDVRPLGIHRRGNERPQRQRQHRRRELCAS